MDWKEFAEGMKAISEAIVPFIKVIGEVSREQQRLDLEMNRENRKLDAEMTRQSMELDAATSRKIRLENAKFLAENKKILVEAGEEEA